MATCYMIVGEAQSAHFDYEKSSASCNTPKAIVDFGSVGFMEGSDGMMLLQSAKYGGKVLDWGASGALLKKEPISLCPVRL